MMLKTDSVRVGHAYVSERSGSIREVVEELDRLRVKYNEFDLQTGQLLPAPFRIAFRSQLARWAEREARPFEVARLHRLETHSWHQDLRLEGSQQVELDLRRAHREQAVGNNVLHRW